MMLEQRAGIKKINKEYEHSKKDRRDRRIQQFNETAQKKYNFCTYSGGGRVAPLVGPLDCHFRKS